MTILYRNKSFSAGRTNCRALPLPRRYAITPDYTSRNARIFAANQASYTRQFIGHSFFGGVHLVPIVVACVRDNHG